MQYFVVTLAFLLAAPAFGADHFVLSSSNDASVNAKNAKAIRASAENRRQHTEADATHLEEIANSELQEARKEEAQVEDELNDAKAIKFVAQNHSDPRAVEEAEDAEALHLVANQEEQHVHQEEQDAKEMKEDAVAINTVSLEDFDAALTDAASTHANVIKPSAETPTKIEEAEADAEHLNEIADNESREARKEEAEVQDEENDAKAISFVSQNHSDPHAAEEAEDATALRLDASLEEKHVHEQEEDAKEMREDADAIRETSLDEQRMPHEPANSMETSAKTNVQIDEEADAKHLAEIADHEDFEAQQEEAKVEDELNDANAISFVAQDHSDPHATEEAEDAEALRMVAKQEKQRVNQEEDEAKTMREDSMAIQETLQEEVDRKDAIKEKDTCITGYPGATAAEKCGAVVRRAEEIRTKMLNYEGHQVFIQTSVQVFLQAAEDDSCKELKAYKEELEATLKRCETSPTCWESTKKSVPSVIKIIDEKMKKKGC